MNSIIICADDYAIAPGVSRAIRRLAAAARIDATSCMTDTEFWPAEGAALRDLASRIAVGLHLALTGGERGGLGALALRAYAGLLDPRKIEGEIARQLDAFERVWGAPPDFVDGHQHAHQLPVVRDAVLALWDSRLDRTRTWLRVSDAPAGPAALKSAAIGALGRAMKRAARARGIRTNDTLAGAYGFSTRTPYRAIFEAAAASARGETVVMCHPGEIDAALRAADALVEPRAAELAYFESDDYAALRATKLRR